MHQQVIHLDPLVCNGHLQAVVKTNPPFLPRPTEGWHSANVLANGNACWKRVVEEVVNL